ncbi:MAG: monooxygenase [Acidimicrobiia bacterium]|nr:monooxygenase [Acidimicrobiia bacterium]
MHVVIEGFDLPGIRCDPGPEGHWYENIHVGLAVRGAKAEGLVVDGRPWKVTNLFAGDADEARWEMDVVVKGTASEPDFGGPFVRGAKGDRHIFLAWGELSSDGTQFNLFRGAKFKLEKIDAALIKKASAPGRTLVGRVGMTDAKGHPACASVGKGALTWTVR